MRHAVHLQDGVAADHEHVLSSESPGDRQGLAPGIAQRDLGGGEVLRAHLFKGRRVGLKPKAQAGEERFAMSRGRGEHETGSEHDMDLSQTQGQGKS